MGLAEIKQQAQAAREAARTTKIETWKGVVDAAVEAVPAITQDQVKARAAEQRLPENFAWISIDVMPDGSTLEAWVDTEGVLDIEVPRDIAAELAAYIEEGGIRCGVEIGAWTDRAVLHASIYEAPVVPEEV